jgi:DNA-binding NarL/FixJ family response regulator
MRTHASGRAPDDPLRAVGAALASQPYARRGVSPEGARAEPLRVMIVDDHAMLRAGLKALLAAVDDVVVVGEASNGVEAVAMAERLAPDIVVMDLDMPGGDGATATRALRELPRPPKVLILSMHTEEERLVPLLEDGVSGYLAKDAADRDLVEAIRVVAEGQTYVRPHVARMLAASVRRAHQPDTRRSAYETLSDREREVLRLTAEGFNGPEMAQQLGISAKTIDTYKQRIGEKLHITHRTEYVRLALELELIKKGGA